MVEYVVDFLEIFPRIFILGLRILSMKLNVFRKVWSFFFFILRINKKKILNLITIKKKKKKSP